MMTHPAGVLGYGTGLPSGGSDTPKGWARVFFDANALSLTVCVAHKHQRERLQHVDHTG